jgi:hypothetical protein
MCPRKPAHGSASTGAYTVVASVLYRAGIARPRACLAYLLSLPPAGCAGVPVSGYAFQRVPGLVRFGAKGWQTPELRLVGHWNGHVLDLTRRPQPAAHAEREPTPPLGCHGQSTPATAALATRITQAHTRIHLLELLPCGARVWILLQVADAATRSDIRTRFGDAVIVDGWLRYLQRS